MSGKDVIGGIEQIRAAFQAGRGAGAGPADPAQVKELAARFESILLLQMIREMRHAGKWEDDSPEAGGLGAETYFETLDLELANHLSSVKGLGFSAQMLDAFEKTAGTPAPATSAETSPLPFSAAPGAVTSAYGWRRDPFTGQAKLHRGVDLRAAYGQDVQTAAPGRVAFSGDQRGYGTTVVVEHANGVETRYAHLSAATVQAGDVVASGQVIGRAGKSGRATGTHLHFEVKVNGRHVAPSEAGLVAPDLKSADEQD